MIIIIFVIQYNKFLIHTETENVHLEIYNENPLQLLEVCTCMIGQFTKWHRNKGNILQENDHMILATRSVGVRGS